MLLINWCHGGIIVILLPINSVLLQWRCRLGGWVMPYRCGYLSVLRHKWLLAYDPTDAIVIINISLCPLSCQTYGYLPSCRVLSVTTHWSCRIIKDSLHCSYLISELDSGPCLLGTVRMRWDEWCELSLILNNSDIMHMHVMLESVMYLVWCLCNTECWRCVWVSVNEKRRVCRRS